MLDRHLPLGTIKDKSFWAKIHLDSEGKLSIPIAPHGRLHLVIWYRSPDGSNKFFVLYFEDKENLPETVADVLAIYEHDKDAWYEEVTKLWR
jgi:hypothetical protein